MDVLEDEHERLRLGQAPQEGEQELEHAPLRERALGAGLGRVELGQQRREARGAAAELVGAQAAQRADDRRVGQLAVAEVDAVAGEHARALRAGAGGELGDQARLADARLAGDQRDRRARRSAARSSAAERPASSRSRPTNSGLVTRSRQLPPPSHRRESTTG